MLTKKKGREKEKKKRMNRLEKGSKYGINNWLLKIWY